MARRVSTLWDARQGDLYFNWNRESVHEDEPMGQTERMAGFYGLRLVFEKTRWVLYNEFIVQTEEFYDFFVTQGLMTCKFTLRVST